MPALDKKIITEYNRTRGNTDKSVLCHAPFTNINFEQSGRATACCYNRGHVLGTYPQDSIHDMWFGTQANALRNYIRQENLEEGCRMCKLQLESGNYAGFKAKLYDQYAEGAGHKANSFLKKIFGSSKVNMPKVMEFELENTCNLECIMCNGDFSSSIRKNREKREPMISPYDATFVKQLTEFMPTLTDMKFLGGEPFMIDIYYDIWEQVTKVNPNIKIHITTNVTMLNSRTKRLLEGMMAGISVSIDSVKKETYEAIRLGANYERVMENLDWLIDYTRRKGTYIWFSICPMVINRYEMPDIIKFANARGIGVFFNTVWWPEEQSLRFLNYDELEQLIQFYESKVLPDGTGIEKVNRDYFQGFISQVRFWQTEKEIPGTAETIPVKLIEALKSMDSSKNQQRSELTKKILEVSKLPNRGRDELKNLAKGVEGEVFLAAYFDCINWVADSYLPGAGHDDFELKIKVIMETINPLREKNLVVSDLVRGGVLYQVNYIASNDINEITKTVKEHYN